MKVLGGKFAEATWNKAADIWKEIRPELEKDPEVAKTMHEVAEKSNEPRTASLLFLQLEKLDLPLETLDQIKVILDQRLTRVRVVSADRGGVAIGDDVQGCTITAGYYSHERNPE